MPDVFKRSISLTIFIVVPTIFINKLLLYLQDIKSEKELLILFLVGIGLVLMIFGVAVFIRGTIRRSDDSRIHRRTK